ncbi:hypothetical protein SAMN05216226_109106 [Halovenus aranensis]|uniref:Uncharacterized protein n=1 Tax=Halovenus aranensis TaxID=890420 RepID=A0A1G8WN12_9EURY|nr:transcriptional regulator [Halovenus aranensis]SDJ79467.1 hypothetical protein SAMN05216226_109106 [Halovenus aranensis]
MTPEKSPLTYGELPPEDALALLGNDIRTAILWTLSEARGGEGPPPVLPFSELRRKADLDVESSRFNYHLQELLGTFVERVPPEETDDDAQVVSELASTPGEGFRLRPEGTTLIRTIRTWSDEGDAWLAPFELDQECYHCDTALEAEYDNAIFAIRCPGCEYVYDYNLTPPGVLGDDREETLDNVAAYNRSQRLAFARGTCPLCGNAVDAEFVAGEETGYPRGDLRTLLVRRGCDHCGNKDNLTLGEVLLRDARLVGFCAERGLDVTTTPIWKLPFAATDRHTTIDATDPSKATLAVDCDGDTLTLTVDDSLSVVDRRL